MLLEEDRGLLVELLNEAANNPFSSDSKTEGFYIEGAKKNHGFNISHYERTNGVTSFLIQKVSENGVGDEVLIDSDLITQRLLNIQYRTASMKNFETENVPEDLLQEVFKAIYAFNS